MPTVRLESARIKRTTTLLNPLVKCTFVWPICPPLYCRLWFFFCIHYNLNWSRQDIENERQPNICANIYANLFELCWQCHDYVALATLLHISNCFQLCKVRFLLILSSDWVTDLFRFWKVKYCKQNACVLEQSDIRWSTGAPGWLPSIVMSSSNSEVFCLLAPVQCKFFWSVVLPSNCWSCIHWH